MLVSESSKSEQENNFKIYIAINRGVEIGIPWEIVWYSNVNAIF